MTVAIGFQGPLSGPFAWLGEGLVRAIQDALAANGSLRLHAVDSAGGAEAARAASEELAADRGVIAVVGPTFSRETEVSAPVLEDAGIPFVLPVATKPELGENGWRGFFRVVASDRVRAPLTAELLINELGSHRVAIAHEEGESATRLGTLLAASLEERGVPAVVTASFQRDAADLGPAVERLLGATPDAVFFAGECADAAGLRRKLSEAGVVGVPFVGDDGVRTPAFVELAGREAAEGAIVVTPSAPCARGFDLGFDHGREPVVFAQEAFVAATLIARLADADVVDRIGVLEALRGCDDVVDGLPVAFDEHGENRFQRLYAYRVTEGSWSPWRELALSDHDSHPRA
jgi:branched-chain amino acid transport system substrate-binding protein